MQRTQTALLRLILAMVVVVSTLALSLPRRRFYRPSAQLVAFAKSRLTTQESQRDSQDLKVDDTSWAGVSNVLVCGDGDLSYSAWLSPRLAEAGISLTATVLEDKDTHHTVYQNSRRHVDSISCCGIHKVCFGVDATRLETCFPKDVSFDRIQFNFPHWRGKTNHRKNRELLSAFFGSASRVLHPNGEVHVALCEGQGGATLMTVEEWRRSWMAELYAAEAGLLLHQLVPYQPEYDLCSHRGVDRPFRIGTSPKLYRFRLPSGQAVDRDLQLCCRHELHLVLEDSYSDTNTCYTEEGLLHGDEILDFCQGLVPCGIRVHVPIRQVLETSPRMIVFLICYCGEQAPLTREQANAIRETLETQLVVMGVKLRENRMGRLVSRPFPYRLLPHLIEEHGGYYS